MLPLTDPAWGDLQSAYGDGTRVAELLARANREVECPNCGTVFEPPDPVG